MPGVDTGYDGDFQEGTIAHAFGSAGVTLVEAARALSQLAVVFNEEEELMKLKDLMVNLELTLLPPAHDHLLLIRAEWEDYPRPRIRPLQSRIRPLQSRIRPQGNLRILDSRSGFKGKSIKRKIGK